MVPMCGGPQYQALVSSLIVGMRIIGMHIIGIGITGVAVVGVGRVGVKSRPQFRRRRVVHSRSRAHLQTAWWQAGVGADQRKEAHAGDGGQSWWAAGGNHVLEGQATCAWGGGREVRLPWLQR